MDSPDDPRIAQIRRYFELMTRGDIPGITALFAPGAEVLSPFLGRMAAPEFFARLGAASRESRLTVHDILLGTGADSAAAHFGYEWTMHSGEILVFEGVDHFTFAPGGRFASLSIFYDTHPLRERVGDKYGRG
jgi:ketosteroid isomerase-like protein